MLEHDNGSIGVEQDAPTLTAAQRAYIDGLRELADFLAEHPEIEFRNDTSRATVLWWCSGASGLADAARSLGRVEKESDESFLNLNRHFGPHRIQAYTGHDGVCERVVVGTETVTREVPDPEALKQVPTVTVTEKREVVEWRCPDSILAGAES